MEVLHQIKGVFVTDSEGKRLFAKYFGELKNHLDTQKKLETNLFSKTIKSQQSNTNSSKIVVDILLCEKIAAVVKMQTDLYFFVVGTQEDNELILSEVLETMVDALDTLFSGQLEKRTILENFDLLVLVVDEILEDGIILDLDATSIAQRIGGSGESGLVDKKKDLLTTFLGSAGEQIKNSLWSFGSN
jgi:hypothetical protein